MKKINSFITSAVLLHCVCNCSTYGMDEKSVITEKETAKSSDMAVLPVSSLKELDQYGVDESFRSSVKLWINFFEDQIRSERIFMEETHTNFSGMLEQIDSVIESAKEACQRRIDEFREEIEKVSRGADLEIASIVDKYAAKCAAVDQEIAVIKARMANTKAVATGVSGEVNKRPLRRMKLSELMTQMHSDELAKGELQKGLESLIESRDQDIEGVKQRAESEKGRIEKQIVDYPRNCCEYYAIIGHRREMREIAERGQRIIAESEQYIHDMESVIDSLRRVLSGEPRSGVLIRRYLVRICGAKISAPEICKCAVRFEGRSGVMLSLQGNMEDSAWEALHKWLASFDDGIHLSFTGTDLSFTNTKISSVLSNLPLVSICCYGCLVDSSFIATMKRKGVHVYIDGGQI